jgi:membrane-bound lytic murein transglycosylase D
MKKFFLLYFLVLSPLLFSQDSYRSNLKNLINYPNLDAGFNFLENNLAIIDNNYSNYSNSLLTEPTNFFINSNESNFSSLVLIKQLKELNDQSPFQIQHNPTLERYIRVFLKDRRESLSKLMDRAVYYFPIFEEHLDKYDLPLEIKYLAIVESALKPNAVSPSGAKGLWQFMYTTGKQFDLQVGSYVDDRFDPIKSTEAACKYLSSLYKTFNDWDLALAAYNSGPGNVKKAITRSGGRRNYWEIRKFLPKETQGYLPAFYATYYIFEYAHAHGLSPVSSSLSYIEIDTVHIKNQLSFSAIQHYVPIKNELLKALNPQYKREIIPYSKKNRNVLILPKTLISKFVENETSLYNPRIQINESSRTAFQISISQLKKWNGLQTDYLIAGQRLVITNKESNNDKEQLFISNENKDILFSPMISSKSFVDNNNVNRALKDTKYVIYTVKEGDTLFNISRKFQNTTIGQIRYWNNISDLKFLKPGTELKIYSIL